MRILFAHNFYRSEMPSGEDSVVQQDIALLRQAGHEVELYAAYSDDIAKMGRLGKATVPARVVWSDSDRRGIRNLAAEFAPDVAHVHNTFPLLSPSVLYGLEEAKVPVVATLHNFRILCAQSFLTRDGHQCLDCLGTTTAPAVKHRCYRGSASATVPLAASIQMHRKLRTWSDRTHALITMSEFGRELLIQGGLAATKLVVRPHSVTRPPVVREGAGERAIHVGRMTPDKGAAWLVEQWPSDGLPLDIVGDGPDRTKIENIIRQRALSNVRLLGQLSRDEARRAMATARMLIVPSLEPETFGLTAAEAMSAGVPVLGTSQGATPEVVKDGVGGIIFDTSEPRSFHRGLEWLSPPDVAIRLGVSAKERYEEHFSPEVSLSSLESIYTDVVAAGAARR